jgi:hypothetical protein
MALLWCEGSETVKLMQCMKLLNDMHSKYNIALSDEIETCCIALFYCFNHALSFCIKECIKKLLEGCWCCSFYAGFMLK